MYRRPHHRVRLNPEPPSGAAYFDPSMLVCAPCQSGAVNYCQTVAPPSTGVAGEDGKFDWLFASARGPVAATPAVSSGVSDCCTTELDPSSGVYKTTCDTAQGCGWVAGPFLTESTSCKFTTEDATYASFEECVAEHPDGGGGTGVDRIDWFAPCAADQVNNCYYPNIDTCLPSIFKQQRVAARPGPPPAPCSAYVCDGTFTVDAAGRRSFPSSACRCVSK